MMNGAIDHTPLALYASTGCDRGCERANDPTEHGHRHHNSRELTAGKNQQPPRREIRGIRKSVPIRDQHSTQIAEINGNPRE